MRSPRWNAPSSLAAECLPRTTSRTHAGGSCSSCRERFVSRAHPSDSTGVIASTPSSRSELALLVDDASAHLPPSVTDTTIYAVARQAEIQAQLAQAEGRAEEAARTKGRATSEDALRKRREREERREAKRRERLEAASNGEPGVLDAEDADDEQADDVPGSGVRSDTPLTAAPSTAGSNFAYTVPIPASSTPLAWYDPFAPTVLPSTASPLVPVPATAAHLTLASARAAGVWTYPETEIERARCAVFRDLWEQGFFMGGGIKFGGDWLVYPGQSQPSVLLSERGLM